tara:strand:- start:191 stop:622 length:432 start_codon:yes stop_codon:yes gene_type:complete
MNIEGIINVSGKSGLHKIISQGKNSVIVESLTDKKRMPIYPDTPANSLEEIGIYTYEDTLPLVDVFISIAKKTNCKECISHKENKNNLELFFREILPDYDEDRVYISDIKKVFQWYNTLYTAGLVVLPKSEKSEKLKNKKEDE